MADIDFNEIAMLMNITSQRPNFPDQGHIFSAAMSRLNEIEAGLAPKPKSAPIPQPTARPTLGRRAPEGE